MSARKAVNPESGAVQRVVVEALQTRLSLSPEAVIFHQSGMEFRSGSPFSVWAEMTLTLHSPGDGGGIHCNGVVIACTGNKHSGYHVSLVFTGLSRQAQARLSTLAVTQL